MHNIALVSINKFKASETFITNHVRCLPAEVHLLHGDYLPKYDPDDHSFGEDLETRKKGILTYLKTHNIEAVLAEYGPSGVEVAPICEEAGIPLIVHFHGYDAYRNDMLNAFGDRYPAMFNSAAQIVAVSKHMRRHLISLGANPDKVHYIPCGADEELFTPVIAGNNLPQLIASGRFAEKKGPTYTIEAFKIALEKVPDAKLIFAGDGQLIQTCKELTQKLEIAERVEFLGMQAHEAIAKLNSQSRAFVQHSIVTEEGDSEGTPVSIMEASLSGLPIISTLHGGIPDVVQNGRTGFLGKERDVKSMAESMILLLQDSDLATTMGTHGYEYVAEHFSLKICISKLWGLIEGEI